mmetsp:Transcript_32722/g.90282  ORF Transcript_32722/g.90282 Transcript_32722/m.90282 type:complete len:227 (+) Transcript_32722:1692-2372(+)
MQVAFSPLTSTGTFSYLLKSKPALDPRRCMKRETSSRSSSHSSLWLNLPCSLYQACVSQNSLAGGGWFHESPAVAAASQASFPQPPSVVAATSALQASVSVAVPATGDAWAPLVHLDDDVFSAAGGGSAAFSQPPPQLSSAAGACPWTCSTVLAVSATGEAAAASVRAAAQGSCADQALFDAAASQPPALHQPVEASCVWGWAIHISVRTNVTVLCGTQGSESLNA